MTTPPVPRTPDAMRSVNELVWEGLSSSDQTRPVAFFCECSDPSDHLTSKPIGMTDVLDRGLVSTFAEEIDTVLPAIEGRFVAILDGCHQTKNTRSDSRQDLSA